MIISYGVCLKTECFVIDQLSKRWGNINDTYLEITPEFWRKEWNMFSKQQYNVPGSHWTSLRICFVESCDVKQYIVQLTNFQWCSPCFITSEWPCISIRKEEELFIIKISLTIYTAGNLFLHNFAVPKQLFRLRKTHPKIEDPRLLRSYLLSSKVWKIISKSWKKVENTLSLSFA